MRKAVKIGFIGVFCAVIGLAFPVFNIFSKQLSMDSHENRLMTGLPQVLQSPLRELPRNLDNFLVDNSPFRYQFVLVNAGLDYALFGTSQSDQVLPGKDGWLFYKDGPNAAQPMANYQGLAELNDSADTLAEASAGLQRLVIGLGKKVLIANQMGAIWEEIAAMSDPTAATAWLGAIAYTFQIYFDFSGYSDMAIGLGHFFGFHFLENFNYPYESRSVTEFWRRWHISLSTWFREYVYIPLGGNRKGKGRQLVNIAIVWLLTGLWHGASWNFVLWGVYYAVLLLLEKTFLLKWLDKAPRFVGHVYTCLCFVLGWVLFAITDFSALGAYLGHMFSGAFADGTTAYLLRCDWLVLALAVVGCTSLPRRLWEKRERAMTPALSDGLRTVWVAVVLLVSIAFLVGDSYNPFLYFRF